MPTLNRTHLSDLLGAARMIVDAAQATTDVVERMHRTIQMRPHAFGTTNSDRTRGITGLVYRNVRGGIGLVGQALDTCLAPVDQWLSEGTSSPARDAYRSVVNGVYGDYLVRTANPLAIDMSLRYAGQPVDPGNPTGVLAQHKQVARKSNKLLVLAHGLCMNEQRWHRDGHDHGAALADELGYLPLYLRYNSGQAIASNGQALAQLLESVTGNWPHPIEELAIIGHSMGGLVARSAYHHGSTAGHAWPEFLRKLVFLGTPHHGAPLERVGNGIDFAMDLSPYSMPLTRLSRARSAGITDLRNGTISSDQQTVPLPSDVECYSAAAVLATERGGIRERLIGDGLVPLDSALGRHRDAARNLAIPEHRQWVGYGVGHFELLQHRQVYAELLGWLK